MKLEMTIGYAVILSALISSTCVRIYYAQESQIENLGTVSHRRGVVLDKGTNTDFVKFIIELKPAGSSNTVTLIRTNDILDLRDFGSIPSGPVLMGVKSVASDGEESELSLYRLEVKRHTLKPPQARSILIIGTNSGPETKNTLEHHLRARTNHTETPPLPSGGSFYDYSKMYADFIMQLTNQIPENVELYTDAQGGTSWRWKDLKGHSFSNLFNSTPMRGGTNKTYSEHMAEMQAHFQRSSRK